MEYNKNTFCKANDKKVLHKIRKHWVVVSTALLMALGGGAATATHVSAHADANNNNGANTSSTDTVKENLNQKLQTPQQNNNTQSASNNQSAPAQNNAKQTSANSNANSQKLTPSNILKAAANLHGAILGNAAQNGAKAQANNNAQQNQSQQSGNGFNAPKVNNNGAKANTTNPLKGVAPKMQVGQSNPADQANANNNKVDFTRPRVMLGDSYDNDASAHDADGLYPGNADYTWDATTKTAMSDFSDYQSDNGSSSDMGEITVRYVDPSDYNFQVGAAKTLVGAGSDYPGHTQKAFTQSDMTHYTHSIPPLQGPYGTGYHLASNMYDSGEGITKYISGKNQELTINVTPNKQPQLPGQIQVDYQDAYNHNHVYSTNVYTASDGANFDESGYTSNPLEGYKTIDTSVSDVNTQNGTTTNVGSNNVTQYTNKYNQVLHIYIAPDTNNDSALVKYVDASDGSFVGTPRTIYGQLNSAITPDTASSNVPAGYNFDNSTTSVNGTLFTNGVGGSTKFTSGNQSVAYVLVTKGTKPNPDQVANMGNINITYATQDGQVIDTVQTSGTNGEQFDMDSYNNNVPDGYSFVSDANPSITDHYNYTGNQTQNYTIHVKKDKVIPPQVTNAYIQYMSIDPSHPSDQPQPISGERFPIYGAPGTPIDYSQYTSNPPQGYVYYGMGVHNPKLYSNQTNVIYVENTKAPNPANNEGIIKINYVSDVNGTPGKTIATVTYEGEGGTSFDDDWANAVSTLPSGYSIDSNSDNPSSISDGTITNSDFTANQTRKATIHLVKSNPNQVGQKVTDQIEYDIVNPNDPESVADENNFTKLTRESTSGADGTNIDYLPFVENRASVTGDGVPKGYTFYTFGSPINSKYQAGGVEHLDVISSDYMPSPIHINYINQSGQNVDYDSNPDNSVNGKGMPIDEEPLTGDLGTTYTMHDISDKRPIPNGYTLAGGQNDISVSVSNHAQSIDIMVNGKPDQTPQKLTVHRIIIDSDGNQMSSDNVPVSITGPNGEIVKVNPSDYKPAPQSYYYYAINNSQNSNDGQPYSVELDGNHLYNVNSGVPSGTLMSDNNTITYVYSELTATANVTYEDASDGNQFVSSKSITGKPNQDMSNVYNNYGLTKLLPSGYNLDTHAGNNGIATSNNSKFLQGQNYVIYVANAHDQNTNSKLNGYGYITVNYQESDGKGHWNTVASETANGSDGQSFDASKYETNTPNGYMPDAYTGANPMTTVSDNNVTKYNKNQNQTFNLHVKTNPNDSYFGKQVSDVINYVALDSNDKPTNNIVGTDTIQGADGSPIDYNSYKSIVPSGYTYASMGVANPDYSQGMNTQQNPIATIYVKKATPFSHNTIPGYNPSDASDVKDRKGNKIPGTSNHTFNPKDPNGPESTSGNYFPWINGKNNDGSGSAPLDGPENPFDPIPNNVNGNPYSYNSDDPQVPNSWENDNKGVLPKGYVPAWVPDKPADSNDGSKYQSGFVPSDDIPNGYEPGFVPNGNGQFVPGYVPTNAAYQPSGKTINGHKVPKYVPGMIPNGHGGKTPGLVPDQSPYATNSSSTLTVEYVNAQHPSDVIQDVNVNGNVGSNLNFSSQNSSNYLYDIPSGYEYAGVLGQKAANGQDYQSDNSTDGFQNISNKNVYGFSDTPHTVQVALNKEAVATVVYEDADNNNAQVGSAMVDGPADTNLNFNQGGADYKYMQLLPYNYKDATLQGSTTPTLSNGAVYTILVHEAHDHNAPSATTNVPNSDDGMLTIKYQDASDNNYTLGTDTAVGKNGTTISNPGIYTTPTSNGGYVPYGYTTSEDSNTVDNDIEGRSFQKGQNQVITIDVKPNKQEANTTTMGNDKIEYLVLSKDGKSAHAITLSTNKDKNGNYYPVESDATNSNHQPMTFDIAGNSGSTIDYSPYQVNVPSGFYYAGMGNHSTVIDGAHNGTNGTYEQIFVRPASYNNGYKNNAAIKIVYHDDSTKSNDSTKGTDVGSTTVYGNDNADFDLGYYEDNTPDGYVFNGPLSSIVRRFNANNNQTQVINVKPAQSQIQDYGTVTIHYVNSNGQSVGKDEVASKLIGTIFDPTPYENDNNSFVPSGYAFDHVQGNPDIRAYKASNQTMTIVVTPFVG